MMSSLPGLEFPAVRNLDIVAKFDGGDLTSDAGLLLVKQADTKLGLVFLIAVGLMFALIVHRLMHKFHWGEKV